MTPATATKANSPHPPCDKAVDNGGLRYGAMESALRPPLPTATPAAGDRPNGSSGEPRFLQRLTNSAGQNIINPIRGSTRKVAGFKSEPRPASNRNQWPASCRNAWPASSESAPMAAMPDQLARAIPLKPFEPFDGCGFADLIPPRRRATAHPALQHRVDHPIAQILRIWLRHPRWPPPSQQVESELQRFVNPRRRFKPKSKCSNGRRPAIRPNGCAFSSSRIGRRPVRPAPGRRSVS
jgi:hypothetical protein